MESAPVLSCVTRCSSWANAGRSGTLLEATISSTACAGETPLPTVKRKNVKRSLLLSCVDRPRRCMSLLRYRGQFCISPMASSTAARASMRPRLHVAAGESSLPIDLNHLLCKRRGASIQRDLPVLIDLRCKPATHGQHRNNCFGRYVCRRFAYRRGAKNHAKYQISDQKSQIAPETRLTRTPLSPEKYIVKTRANIKYQISNLK